MVEYGVIVNNKFCTLNDDENEDPDVILRRTEEACKKEEKEAANLKRASRNAIAKRKKDDAVTKVEQPLANNANKNSTGGAPPLRRKQGYKKEEANKENRAQDVGNISGYRRFRRFYGPGRGAAVVDSSDGAGERGTAHNDANVNAVFDESRASSRGRGFRGRFRGALRRGNYRAAGIERDTRMGNVEEVKRTSLENESEDNQADRPLVTERVNVRRRFQRGGRGQFDRSSGEVRFNNRSYEKRGELSEKSHSGFDSDVHTNERKGLGASDEKKDDTSYDKVANGGSAEDAENLLTLDEFKAQMAAKRSEPQFNIRKAGEGANEKEFGKLVPLTKHSVNEEIVDEAVVVRRTPRSKRLDIEINFTDDQRSRGGAREGFRVGRESFRGGRGSRRMDGRSFRGISKQSFEVSADAFPALGEQ